MTCPSQARALPTWLTSRPSAEKRCGGANDRAILLSFRRLLSRAAWTAGKGRPTSVPTREMVAEARLTRLMVLAAGATQPFAKESRLT